MAERIWVTNGQEQITVRQPGTYTEQVGDGPVVRYAVTEGPAGPPGARKRFVFTQDTPAATWTIPHNLGMYPVFNLFVSDDPFQPVYTDISYPNATTAVVEWPSPESGRAEA